VAYFSNLNNYMEEGIFKLVMQYPLTDQTLLKLAK